MENNNSETRDFREYMKPGAVGYLIGIGGVSMSPLGEVLLLNRQHINGSDIRESETVEHLRGLGIRVNIGHDPQNITRDIDYIVRTAAVHDDNPEILAAKALGIPVFERTEAWGALSLGYSNALCVSGTHGKTTTTSMATHIFMAARRDPTVMIGGTLPLLKAGHRIGAGDTIIMEACEYYNSFHSFFPTVAVILNIEEDHLDFFSGIDEIKRSFKDFAALVPEDGYIVANHEDQNTMDALAELAHPLVTFGLDESADICARNIERDGMGSTFDIYNRGEFFTSVELCIPGIHNVKNALAAAAAAICLNIPPAAVSEGLGEFYGTERRLQLKGSFNGADVYDDYAHHPSELGALLDAVETLNYERIILLFQPHTFTRTHAFFDEFVEQLKRPDVTLLAEIYAARESNMLGISSADLKAKIPGSEYFGDFDSIDRRLRELASPGDIILTVGAGDIYKAGEQLCAGG